VEYEVYQPAAATAGQAVAEGQHEGPTLVLAHGFMRRLENMEGWAAHLASHGVRTVVVSFCNSSWFSGNHDRNAEDLVAVADTVVNPVHDAQVPGRVIYGGYSAGGLAALLAATNDERAVAYLGLDAVDSGNLASTASRISIPALFLFGEPSACNADSNMVDVLPDGPFVLATRVSFATHCDFELPYDRQCERICGSVEPTEVADQIRTTIRAIAAAWIVASAEETDSQETDATELFIAEARAELERLVSLGVVAPVR
jgi:pimeloyl-ACP methyl ester carboxylesterase